MKVAERRIAGLVIARGQVSKAEIESALGYSHPTVVNAVGALVAEGVLRESGEFNSTGGRRAKAISPNPSFRYFGGVDVTRNHVTFVLLDWAGKVVARERRRRPFSARPGDLRELGAAFRTFASAKGVAVAGKVCGNLAEATGGWQMPMLVAVVVSVIGAAIFLCLWRTRANAYE